MANVLCFGELLLRLSPVLNRQWIRNASMPVYVGGAELNVAQALSKWKLPVNYFTAVPDHYLTNPQTQFLIPRPGKKGFDFNLLPNLINLAASRNVHVIHAFHLLGHFPVLL